ncbi:M20/M25/M40 family metallo-hydrolase [Vibrio mexicanus]|uniref:M20/M25/M40 family metallo-hydrolase n=1 Tax=Vibrio mexicanus TaxID=1004326 RepID=UPI000B054CD8|nr:M20/M25/M40 family metallo-hydrolase [Vibrio mexicanus]
MALCHIKPSTSCHHAELINALQTIKSRNVQPTEPLVVSITDAHAGSGTHNVIPETATLKGSIRAFNAEVSSLAIERMKQIAQGIALAHNAEINVTIKDGSYPATINNAGATQVAHQAAINVVGKDKVSTNFPPFTGSEDFAFFLQQVPGCYLFIGNGSEGKTGGVCVHNPLYDFNDRIIPLVLATLLNSSNKK